MSSITTICLIFAALAMRSPASPPIATFSFVPNQLAGNAWYKPGSPPTLINGHLDSSFGNRSLWPQLLGGLKSSHGSFAIFAAEIGCLSSRTGLLPLLRANQIPISVETPGFTQCIEGDQLAGAEIRGDLVKGVNIFSTIFGITSPTDHLDPKGRGWFVTRDGIPFVPDELLFDERIPNLLPTFDPAALANPGSSWEQRKSKARVSNGCALSSLPYPALVKSLTIDYVKYLDTAKGVWGKKMPAVSLHWNVNPGWEWRDEKGLDAIHAASPAYFDKAENFWAIVANRPQYNSVNYLNDLVDILTAAGFKPRTVFMDVDWTYNIPYITEALKRHKTALADRGIQLGINVVEASIADHDELKYENHTLVRHTESGTDANLLYERTLVAITMFLKGEGLYTKGIQLRVGSWSHRPYETGAGVSEKIPGSMAHAANAILKQL